MAKITTLRAFLKRAKSLHSKSEAIFADMMAEYPDDDALTDAADDVMNMADDLCGMIERRIAAAKGN